MADPLRPRGHHNDKREVIPALAIFSSLLALYGLYVIATYLDKT